jgi:hypothetical protein
MSTIKYGGGPNPPVRLDKWQNIVGVGWGDTSITHTACRISIGTSGLVFFNQDPNEACTAPGDVDQDASTFVWAVQSRYVEKIDLDFELGNRDFFYYSAAGWTPTGAGRPLLGSLDVPEEFAFDEWQAWDQNSTFFPPLHRRRFIAPGDEASSGDDPSSDGIPVPGKPETFFGPSSAQFEVYGWRFVTEETLCYRLTDIEDVLLPFASRRGRLVEDYRDPAGIPLDHPAWPGASIPVDITALSMTAGGVTFRGVGTYADPANPQSLWVLFERVGDEEESA